jgi:hypothetical protein
MKQTYKKFKVGDLVSVRNTDSSYDHGPEITPEMTGIIKSFPPKVCKVKGPLFDNGDYFAYIEFNETYESYGRTCQVRGGIDICNLKKVNNN